MRKTHCNNDHWTIFRAGKTEMEIRHFVTSIPVTYASEVTASDCPCTVRKQVCILFLSYYQFRESTEAFLNMILSNNSTREMPCADAAETKAKDLRDFSFYILHHKVMNGVLKVTEATDVIPHNLCWCTVEGLGEILEKPALVLDDRNARSSFPSEVPKNPQNATCLQIVYSCIYLCHTQSLPKQHTWEEYK